MAKTGLKSIYANESYILPEPMLCATFLLHVAQTTDSLARKAKYGLSLIYGNESIFSKRILCATILLHVAQTSEFFAELGAKTRLKSIYANESNI